MDLLRGESRQVWKADALAIPERNIDELQDRSLPGGCCSAAHAELGADYVPALVRGKCSAFDAGPED